MMQAYFQNLVNEIEAARQAAPERVAARKIFALEVARLGTRLYSGAGQVAWCGVTAPFDLLNAMGVTSCFVEFVGAMLASTGLIGATLQAAEQAGYAADTCGYHRAVIGAALQGLMPVPDFLIATTSPCSGGLATIENLARLFKKDLFVLQIPQEDTPAAVSYLAGQFRRMVEFVAHHTGRPLDDEKLEQSLAATNRTRESLLEVYRLARSVPSPASSNDLRNFGIVLPLFLGTAGGEAVARAYREEFTARCQAGSGGGRAEKIRLLWIQNRVQFHNPLEALLAKEYGATVVIDELNNLYWEPIDPRDPYPGLARRAIHMPLNGTVDHRAALLTELALEYRVDGAINPCHWGCRQGTGARGLIADRLRESGVPVLNLEVDCVDPRNFPEGQLRTRLEAFLELIVNRRPAETATDTRCRKIIADSPK